MISQLKQTNWTGHMEFSCITFSHLQAELRKELVPMKKHLRCLYEAKQECDDTTVHIKVSIKTGRREKNSEASMTSGRAQPTAC